MKPQSSRGFTLIELLIAVAILGILAVLAYPAFQDQLQASRRADGIAGLESLRMDQVSYRANNRLYATLAQLGGGSSSSAGYYTLAVTANTATGFAATATPVGVQANDNCGTLTMNQDGPVGTASHLKNCWGR